MLHPLLEQARQNELEMELELASVKKGLARLNFQVDQVIQAGGYDAYCQRYYGSRLTVSDLERIAKVLLSAKKLIKLLYN